MTYEEALASGYKNSHTARTRGYVSRKVDVKKQVVQYGGRKHDKPFVLIPAWDSSQYCFRQYITK